MAIGINVDVGAAGSIRVWVGVIFEPWQHVGDRAVFVEQGGIDYCRSRCNICCLI